MAGPRERETPRGRARPLGRPSARAVARVAGRPSARAVARVAARLAAAGCVAAGEEARELVAAMAEGPALEAAVRRRERGEPLAWITGTTTFCGHLVRVDGGVYVPRPQSEALAGRGAALLDAAGPGALGVDLCTGSGAVALALTRGAPGALVVGLDADYGAVSCARRNGVAGIVGDLGAPLPDGCAAVVTAVAPYVPTAAIAYLPADVQRHEPRPAIDGGPDGLDVVRRIVADAGRLLRPGGWLLLEIGADQDGALAPVLERSGFRDAASWHDEDGDLRGVLARRPVSRSPGRPPAGTPPALRGGRADEAVPPAATSRGRAR